MLSTHDIDRHIGARLRYLRKSHGLTQNDVGQGIGISLQQIQKYEQGTNRIAANYLWRLSTLFDVEIGYFFQGLREEGGPVVAPDDVEVFEVSRKLQSIRDEKIKRQVIAMIESFFE